MPTGRVTVTAVTGLEKNSRMNKNCFLLFIVGYCLKNFTVGLFQRIYWPYYWRIGYLVTRVQDNFFWVEFAQSEIYGTKEYIFVIMDALSKFQIKIFFHHIYNNSNLHSKFIQQLIQYSSLSTIFHTLSLFPFSTFYVIQL